MPTAERTTDRGSQARWICRGNSFHPRTLLRVHSCSGLQVSARRKIHRWNSPESSANNKVLHPLCAVCAALSPCGRGRLCTDRCPPCCPEGSSFSFLLVFRSAPCGSP